MTDLVGNSLGAALNIGVLNGNRGFSESVSSSDRNDYYKFTLASSSNFSLSMTGLRNNADVRLLSSSGATIASSTRSGRSNESIARQLGAGEYYVRVSQRSGSTNYNLGLTAIPLPPPPPPVVRADPDPGATFATAFGVNLATGPKLYRQEIGVTDPVDTYRFTLNSASTFGATLSGLTGDVYLSLYYDANNSGAADSDERITRNYNSGASATINQTLGAGTYFVEVQQYYSTSNTAYNLNLGATAVTGIQPTVDPGDSLATAFNVGALSGSRAYRQFIGVVDPVDTYRFTLNSASTFGATLSGLTGDVYLSLYFDSNNNGAADSDERITRNYNSGASATINQTLGAGTYFVEVRQYYATSNTAYNLNLVATAVTGIQPAVDPGDSLATAFNVGALSGSRAYRQFIGVVDPVDTYRFTLNSTSTLGATLSGLTGDVYLSLYYDANNNGVADSDERITRNYNSGASATINQTLGAGTYFVEVRQYYATSNTAYNLNLGATAVTGIQPTVDPGDTLANAFDVGALSGSRAYRQFIGVVDPVDTYRFTLNSTRPFGATLSGLTGDVYLSLYFDSNDNGVADSNERITRNYNSGASATINQTLGAGTYFVEVRQYYATSNTAYNLNLGA